MLDRVARNAPLFIECENKQPVELAFLAQREDGRVAAEKCAEAFVYAGFGAGAGAQAVRRGDG